MNGERAPIFDLYEKALKGRGWDWSDLSRSTGIDYHWLMDFKNDGKIAEQVRRIKAIEDALGIPPMPMDEYQNKGGSHGS